MERSQTLVPGPETAAAVGPRAALRGAVHTRVRFTGIRTLTSSAVAISRQHEDNKTAA